MRFFIAVLLSLLASATMAADMAVETCRGVPMPPLDKRTAPTVYFTENFVSRAVVRQWCGAPLHPLPAACAFPHATAEHPDAWAILISRSLSPEDKACVRIYERSHLPPNNWQDKEVETTYHLNPR